MNAYLHYPQLHSCLGDDLASAAAAVIAFFLVEDLSGSMGWFNVWTWLFAGILVVQAIVATLTMKTSND